MEISDIPNDIDSDYSESFIDFYRSQPSWLIRYGLVAIVTMLIIIFSVGSFISYPDVIESRAVVSSETPPVFIKAKLSGVIDSIAKKDLEDIKKNDIVAIFESTVDYKDYIILKDNLLSKSDSLRKRGLNIGELQEYYNSYMLDVEKENIRNTLNESDLKKTRLRSSLVKKIALIKNLIDKMKLMNSEVLLDEKQLDRFSGLHAKGVISTNDLEEFQKLLFSKKQRAKDIEVTISLNELEVIEIQKLLDDNFNREYETGVILSETLKNSRRILIEKMKIWEETHLLTASASGKIFYHKKSVEKGTNIELGEEVFTILPEKHGDVICEMTIPFFNSGKVAIGQDINLFLDNYPFQEYGTIRGKIISISAIPNKDGYFVKALLPNDLETTYGTKIGYKPSLIGRCEVITENQSLIERIFNKLKGIFDNV